MQKHLLMLATSAFILACGGIAANAQQTPGGPMQQDHHPQTQQQPTDHEGRGMMGQGGMMGRGMMGPMGPAMMMRIIFSLMDSDGDGTISLPEFQAAHERIFKAMDANKDGRLTLEEMQAFMQGPTRSIPRQ
ncbi:MAG TPA: EF-hand domain-containing protein [Pyrinomonadaceae bacterium]